MSNPVGWFELYVTDMARAKAFYEAVIKRPLSDLPTPPGVDIQMAMFEMSRDGTGAAGALVKHPDVLPGAGGTIVYFSCEDCSVEAARAAANGGKVQLTKRAIGEYGFIAMIEDTEGNVIGLHSPQ